MADEIKDILNALDERDRQENCIDNENVKLAEGKSFARAFQGLLLNQKQTQRHCALGGIGLSSFLYKSFFLRSIFEKLHGLKGKSPGSGRRA
jgi:hypothetical protein